MIEAEAKGKYSFGYQSDMSKLAPKSQLSAVVHNWGPYYTKTVGDVLSGKWAASDTWGSYAEGFVQMAPFNPAVPKDVASKVMQLESDLKAGKTMPFAGPIQDNEGKQRVAAGTVLSASDMQKMDFYVMGVTGKVPK